MKAVVKEELFRWACQKHAANTFLDKELLREKALELTGLYGLKGFKCSDKWLTQFLREHGFPSNLRKNCGGPVFNDYRDWIDVMRPTIIKYRHRDLFHADELTMYSDIPPSTIPSDGVENSATSESARNRITILMGCNSTATTKLPLLISGPYPSKITVNEHAYCHTDSSYIGEDLFKTWLVNLNDRMACCDRKILLFLRRNRARALKDFEPRNVHLVYLPENFPPHLHPLRRDVFHYIKMIFRRRYVEHLKRYNSEWELRDVLSSVIEAWQTIPRELIVFSFQRTQFRTDDCFLRIDCDCWDNQKAAVSFRRFVTFDDDLSDERIPGNKDDPYDGYRRKDNSKDVVEIDEDSLESAAVDMEGIGNAESGHLSDESERVSPPVLLEREKHAYQQLDGTMVRTRGRVQNDMHRIARQSRLKANPIEDHSEQGKSQKGNYAETQFSAKGRVSRSDRHTAKKKILRNTFPSKEPIVRLSKSTRGKVFKERTPRKHRANSVNDGRDSCQAIMYKTFALPSPMRSNCSANKPTHSVYVSNRETTKKPDRSTKSKHLNEQSECAGRETDGSKRVDKPEEGKNKIEGNTAGNVLGKFNQPSTSTTDCNDFSPEIGQSDSEETIESQSRKIASSDTIKLDEQCQDPSQNSNAATTLCNENSSCSTDRKALQFYRKKRRKTEVDTDSKGNSDQDEPKRKELKMDPDWSKQFETTFVFGTPNVNSSLGRQDENIIDTRMCNMRPTISPRN